jgi:hypothetical protein
MADIPFSLVLFCILLNSFHLFSLLKEDFNQRASFHPSISDSCERFKQPFTVSVVCVINQIQKNDKFPLHIFITPDVNNLF